MCCSVVKMKKQKKIFLILKFDIVMYIFIFYRHLFLCQSSIKSKKKSPNFIQEKD